MYSREAVAPVSAPIRERCFARETLDGESCYRVRDTLRDMVVFRRLDLATLPFPLRGPLDIVFCRNVLVCFDNFVRTNLLGEIHPNPRVRPPAVAITAC